MLHRALIPGLSDLQWTLEGGFTHQGNMSNNYDGWRADAALDRRRARTRCALFCLTLMTLLAIGLIHAESETVQAIASALGSIHHP